MITTILARKLVTYLCLLLVFPALALAEIKFQDVSDKAKISHSGTTYGASWGDFNGDGWPDIWVGNHNSKPTLYLNKQNGTFDNIIDQVWSGDPKADTHGAAWADFDNDGDQDLVELVDVKENDDGTFCVGCGKNLFFVNDSGKLIESAEEFGLAHSGYARSPVWYDMNQDGFLDLLVVNTRGRNQPTSKVYLQKDKRFIESNKVLNFKDRDYGRSEKLRLRIQKLMFFKYPSLPYFAVQSHLEFAQLADLSSNGHLDLILYSKPTRIFAMDVIPFKELTGRIHLPQLAGISDVAAADFNGDQRIDLYVARGVYMPSDVEQTTPSSIKGRINGIGIEKPKAVHFQSEGEVHFQVYPTWLHLSKVYIGSTGRHPTNRRFTLSSKDPAVHGSASPADENFDGITIGYDNDLKSWVIHNLCAGDHVDFIADGNQPIQNIKTIGFDPFQAQGIDALIMNHEDGFNVKTLTREAGAHTSGYFVVAADFDNDMDVDIYMTCTGPVVNLPNRLLENDGQGNFTLVPNAGGASGSKFGRGDAVAVADYDRDGFLDLFITNGHDPTSPFTAKGPHQLFRNQGNDNKWLEIDLAGTKSNRDGIGARVEIETNGIVQMRYLTGGMHRITQNYQRLHFGMGKHEQADRITVHWPSGKVQHLDNVKANQVLSIVEST
jgi:hypothetical protein